MRRSGKTPRILTEMPALFCSCWFCIGGTGMDTRSLRQNKNTQDNEGRYDGGSQGTAEIKPAMAERL